MAEPAPTIAAAAKALRANEATSETLTRNALARIAERDERIHAFVRLDAEGALAAARQADRERAAGVDRGPMHGVPYAIKDIYDAAGMPTTCHSRLRLDHVAAEDSEVCRRFREAGAILLGKLGTFEFALGGPSEDLPFPLVRNPWDVTRTSGGSSSGSAAAIAAGYVAIAPGSCTTGSIRGPAAWCGNVGLKPTFGRVSRRGVFPLAWSLDHCGPLSRTVEDAAIALAIMAGPDKGDPACADAPVDDYLAGIDNGVAGVRIGAPRAFYETSPMLSEDARQGIDRALAALGDLGARIEETRLPDPSLFLACGRVLMVGEAYAIHRADLAARLGEYGGVAARRFAVGAMIDAADYLAAQQLRRTLTRSVDEALARHDLLVTAISLASAPLNADIAGAWPMQASAFNVTGHPALSVPIGLDRHGLPLAVQIVGRRFDEALVLRAGRAIEKASNWLATPLPP